MFYVLYLNIEKHCLPCFRQFYFLIMFINFKYKQKVDLAHYNNSQCAGVTLFLSSISVKKNSLNNIDSSLFFLSYSEVSNNRGGGGMNKRKEGEGLCVRGQSEN